ncbi:MAG: hypothetical protein RMY36_009085 [Nostoc sp. SerVER01]|nr:hypothetical protein [Nostoc sp. DcaGUA01]
MKQVSPPNMKVVFSPKPLYPYTPFKSGGLFRIDRGVLVVKAGLRSLL